VSGIATMSDPPLTAQRLKGRSFAETRGAVLDLIRSEGEISRTDLARRSALTEKTISGIVKSLIDSGVVIESGYAKSTGGKRPILLRLNDKELYAIGVTLDIARCIIVVCALDGAELCRSEIRGTGTDQPASVLKRISANVLRLLQRRGIDKRAVVGVGVASGGRRGSPPGWRVDATFADLWEPFPTEDELAKLTGLSVLRENDANCAALGEYWTTGSSPTRDFATVYMAYGIGCGIVIGGSIFRGASGNAGEIGHTLADPHGVLCWCGRHGCLETLASPRAITQQILQDPTLTALCQVTHEMEFGEIYRRYGRLAVDGVEPVASLFRTAADHLADAVINLVNTLDLDLISLAGPGFAELGENYTRIIEARLADTAFMREVHPITVRLGSAGPDAAALGAASVVLQRQLTPHRSAAPL
jgi:predicted NBD/HSP70 family sugar kinase